MIMNVVIDVTLQLSQVPHDEFDVSGLAPAGSLWVSVFECLSVAVSHTRFCRCLTHTFQFAIFRKSCLFWIL